jgi:hypothetical protein
VIIGGALDHDEFDPLLQEPGGGSQGIMAMLMEFLGLQLPRIGLVYGGYDDVLVGVAASGDVVARMYLRLPTGSDASGHIVNILSCHKVAMNTRDLRGPVFFRAL